MSTIIDHYPEFSVDKPPEISPGDSIVIGGESLENNFAAPVQYSVLLAEIELVATNEPKDEADITSVPKKRDTRRYRSESRSKKTRSGNDYPLTYYFNDISVEPLLSREEEIELCTAYRRGLAAKQKLENTEIELSEIQRTALKKELLTGEEAKDRFLTANLRLVVSVAKLHQNKGLDFEDLIQEGNFGLFTAFDKFDTSRGNKFSTYARWWINQKITRAIDNTARDVKIPVEKLELYRKIYKYRNILAQELGRMPSDEEVADKIDMDLGNLKEIENICKRSFSLQEELFDGESTRADLIEDLDATTAISSSVEKIDLKNAITNIMGMLSEKERTVIKRRFGFNGKEETLTEIGNDYDVTKERIRQIEARALLKIRNFCEKSGIDYNSILKVD